MFFVLFCFVCLFVLGVWFFSYCFVLFLICSGLFFFGFVLFFLGGEGVAGCYALG